MHQFGVVQGNPLLEEDESSGLSGLSGGVSLPVGVAAAAPLVGFAGGLALVWGPECHRGLRDSGQGP